MYCVSLEWELKTSILETFGMEMLAPICACWRDSGLLSGEALICFYVTHNFVGHCFVGWF